MLRTHQSGTELLLRVQPRSRKQGIVGTHGGRLKVAVHAAPEKGKANAAVLELLAEALELKRYQVQLLSGETSQEKSVLLSGVTMKELQHKLEKWIT